MLSRLYAFFSTSYRFESFTAAARDGDIAALNTYLEQGGFDPAANNNYALLTAVGNGHLIIVDRLLNIPAVLANVIANATDVLRFAATTCHLTVVNRLLEIPAVLATASNTEALDSAAHNGRLAVVNRLLEIPAVNAAASDSYALRWAAEEGHLAVVSRLLEIPAVLANAAIDNNYALGAAARNGHLEVVNRLLEIPAALANATANFNYALSFAARNGHLAVVNRLLEIPSVLTNVTAGNNYALREATRNGHLTVVNCLLEIPAVLANATAGNNYALYEAQMRANGSDEDRARYQPIVDRLMQIPAVAQLSTQQSQQHGQQGQALANITQFSENSMMVLSKGEFALLDNLKKHYKEIYKSVGWKKLRDDMLRYLAEAYTKSPAKDEHGNILPLEYAPNRSEAALKAYYKHNIHTAWRYLSQQNPWMAPDAQNVQRFSNGEGAAIIMEPEQAIIGYLWIAVNDKTVTLEKTFTLEGNKNIFMDTLAMIARSHNRDERPVDPADWEAFRNHVPGIVTTTADDEGPDKPSCPWGVKKALFQGFYGHPYINCPEAQPLSPEIMLNRMVALLVQRKESLNQPDNIIDMLDCLSVTDLEKLRDELIDFYDPDSKGKEEENPILSISREQRDIFIANAKLWFSAKRIEEKQSPPLVPNSIGSDEYSTHPCHTYVELIEYLADNPIPSFSQYLMTEYLPQRIELLKQEEAKNSNLGESMVEETSPTYTPSRKHPREDDNDNPTEPEVKRARTESGCG